MDQIRAEAIGFLIAVVTGGVIVVCYTCIALFRKIIAHTRKAVSIEDTIFWICVSGYVFWKMFQTSYGQIRWQFVAGVLLGCGVARGIICRIKKRC